MRSNEAEAMASGGVRIIAGKWRSRRLAMPDPSRTRPMPDRVRESVFDILASRYALPGTLPAVEVADLFAGTGGMGFEALSRGASGCDFVERDREAVAVLRENAAALHVDSSCRIHRANAWTLPLSSPRPSQPYGLIFVDPPYADVRGPSPTRRVSRLLSDFVRAGWVDATSIVVLHHPADIRFVFGADSSWTVDDQRTYGSAGISLAVLAAVPSPEPSSLADAPECSASNPMANESATS